MVNILVGKLKKFMSEIGSFDEVNESVVDELTAEI